MLKFTCLCLVCCHIAFAQKTTEVKSWACVDWEQHAPSLYYCENQYLICHMVTPPSLPGGGQPAISCVKK